VPPPERSGSDVHPRFAPQKILARLAALYSILETERQPTATASTRPDRKAQV
jgi:hypothetical protein